jgi:hypothetical protein
MLLNNNRYVFRPENVPLEVGQVMGAVEGPEGDLFNEERAAQIPLIGVELINYLHNVTKGSYQNIKNKNNVNS